MNQAPVKNQEIDLDKIVAKQTLDCSGLQCPGPIMKVFQTIKDMQDGEILQVSATDMGFARDIEAWCKRMDNKLLKTERIGKENIRVYSKRNGIKSSGRSRHSRSNHCRRSRCRFAYREKH